MNYYLVIILAILIGDYLLELIIDTLNVRHAKTDLPHELQDTYDAEKYRKSQEYLKEKEAKRKRHAQALAEAKAKKAKTPPSTPARRSSRFGREGSSTQPLSGESLTGGLARGKKHGRSIVEKVRAEGYTIHTDANGNKYYYKGGKKRRIVEKR